MHYLSMFGVDGFRTFLGMLTGNLLYTPERITQIDPEIISERDFSLRLQELLKPYLDDHPQLKNITPIISSDIGELWEINDNFALWQPKTHFAELGERIIASLIEVFLPEELNKTLYYINDFYDSGIAFSEAFSLENKKIIMPSYLNNVPLPPQNSTTKLYQIDQNKNSWNKTRNILTQKLPIQFDGRNFFRILGHMGTIIHALHQTEKKRIRFFNDPVSLVLPADNAEYILAGYYLTKSQLPITNIYAVSYYDRMIYNLLDKGEFTRNISNLQNDLLISLYRLLFEASRASINKLSSWKNELQIKGTFKVDSKTLDNLQTIFKPIFATQHLCEGVDNKFVQSRITKCAYNIAKNSKEIILAFDLQNPYLVQNSQKIPDIKWEDILNEISH